MRALAFILMLSMGLFVKTQEFRYSIITFKNCAQLIYLSAVDLVTI